MSDPFDKQGRILESPDKESVSYSAILFSTLAGPMIILGHVYVDLSEYELKSGPVDLADLVPVLVIIAQIFTVLWYVYRFRKDKTERNKSLILYSGVSLATSLMLVIFLLKYLHS